MHIDDRLPCNRMGDPLYSRCKNRNQIWVAIIEKAYAKLHGCYENLSLGYISDALIDLTGNYAMVNKVHLRQHPLGQHLIDGKGSRLWRLLLDSYTDACPVIVHYTGNKTVRRGHHSGILSNMPYSILKVVEGRRLGGVWTHALDEEDGEIVQLIQLYNPWGMRSWDGAWSNGDHLWDGEIKLQTICGYNPEAGVGHHVFWMSYQDFMSWFDELTIVVDPHHSWQSIVYQVHGISHARNFMLLHALVIFRLSVIMHKTYISYSTKTSSISTSTCQY